MTTSMSKTNYVIACTVAFSLFDIDNAEQEGHIHVETVFMPDGSHLFPWRAHTYCNFILSLFQFQTMIHNLVSENYSKQEDFVMRNPVLYGDYRTALQVYDAYGIEYVE